MWLSFDWFAKNSQSTAGKLLWEISKWTNVTPFSLKYAPNSLANADGFNVGSFTFFGSVTGGFSAPFFYHLFLHFLSDLMEVKVDFF